MQTMEQILNTPGSSRDERLLKYLLPENVRLDERDVPEWLAFLAKAAGMLQYTNPANGFSGHWDAFLKNDPSVFFALLMEEKPEVWDEQFRKDLRKYYAALDHQEKASRFMRLLEQTKNLALCLNGYYQRSLSLSNFKEDNPVKIVLHEVMGQRFMEDMQLVDELLAIPEKKEEALQRFLRHFDPKLASNYLNYADTSLNPADADDNNGPDIMVGQLRPVFQKLHLTLVYLSKKAPEWFNHSLEHKNDHTPYMGLLLSFLQLFRHVRDQMNTLTEQHLNHYYFDLLAQKRRSPVPDRTIVCFQLAEHVEKYWVEKNTLLLASVNDQGLESHYATETPLMLTRAKLVQMKTLFVGHNEAAGVESSYRLVTGVYAAPVANSSDGLGQPLVGPDLSWPVFGEEQIGKNPGERRMVGAPLGFAVSAPILVLHEGQRTIDLCFKFTSGAMSWLLSLLDDIRYHNNAPTELWVHRIFNEAFTIMASTTEGWFPIRHYHLDASDKWADNNGITLTLSLTVEDPPLVSASPDVLGEDYDTPWPVVKITVNPEAAIYPYSFIAQLEVETLGIEVRVEELRSLSVYNELGLLDISAPFMPFGSLPKRNASFVVGHPEFLGKKLTNLSFNLDWAHLPETEGGFAQHYQGYPEPVDNSRFKVRISALTNYRFWPLAPENQQEIAIFKAESPKGKLLHQSTIDNIDLVRLQIQADYTARDLPEFTNKTRSGFFKFQLSQPSMAFGHTEYPRLFTQALIAQSKPAGFLGRTGEPEVVLPQEPYVPLLNQITASYQANTVLNMRPLEAANNEVNAREKVFCLHPFGRQLIFNEGRTADRYLFPRFEADGYLLLGFSGVEPNNPLNLLFHLSESHNKNWGDGIFTVHWEYLHSNRWESLTQEYLLSDGTKGFTTTGIVRLIAPSFISTDNTIMPPGLLWLRVSAKGSLQTAGRALGIYPDAVEVVWVNNGDDSHFDPNRKLPLLKELVVPRSEVAAIIQPVDFFGGNDAETLPEFYMRVSERLRHKNRGVTAWDIEHLILAQFPAIKETRCITANAHPNIAPGTMTVVVVPFAPDTVLEPSVSFHQSEEIRHFIDQRTSSFAKVRVINPDYERIKISCAIRLKPGLEQEAGWYARHLHEELLHFICPWLKKGRVSFGEGLSRNDVITFITNRPYVQFVTRLSLVKIFKPSEHHTEIQDTAHGDQSLETLRPETPWSVFVPVAQHNITFLSYDKSLPPEVTAIEAMRLGTDFVVGGYSDDSSEGADSPGGGLYSSTDLSDADDDWFILKA